MTYNIRIHYYYYRTIEINGLTLEREDTQNGIAGWL